jgi:hypothetical protein
MMELLILSVDPSGTPRYWVMEPVEHPQDFIKGMLSTLGTHRDTVFAYIHKTCTCGAHLKPATRKCYYDRSCLAGVGCTFSHDPVCRPYQDGVCTRGTSCVFSHRDTFPPDQFKLLHLESRKWKTPTPDMKSMRDLKGYVIVPIRCRLCGLQYPLPDFTPLV